ncbi:hypothetical protein [Acrocarpospora phusangensis]|nr:hypothetical protein [Acrocarpospora phusangensis]
MWHGRRGGATATVLAAVAGARRGAAVLAVWPARTAARPRVANVLRAE